MPKIMKLPELMVNNYQFTYRESCVKIFTEFHK